MYAGLSDKELWTKVVEGDKNALAHIYDMHFPTLYRYGMKLSKDDELVKDCIHDLFVTVWHSKERLSITDSIKYYLLASLKRLITNHLQKSQLNQSFTNDDYFAEASYESELINHQVKQERNRKLAAIVNELPPRQREILYLRYYEGLDTNATAHIMSLSINSTYVLLSKALQHLKKHSDKLIIIILSLLIH